MDSDQLAIFRYNFSSPRLEDWASAPLVRADWRDLSVDEALITLRSIEDWFGREEDLSGLIVDHAIERMRVADLICYPNSMLVECQGFTSDGQPGLFSVLIYEEGMIRLTGSSLAIHGHNTKHKPDLSTVEKQIAYLEFFMNWVHGEHGRFQPLRSETDIRTRCRPGASLEFNMSFYEPFPFEYVPQDEPDACGDDDDDEAEDDLPSASDVLDEGEEPNPTFKTLVLYGSALFEAAMMIHRTGMVEMKDDDVILEDLPVIPEKMEGYLLVQRRSDF